MYEYLVRFVLILSDLFRIIVRSQSRLLTPSVEHCSSFRLSFLLYIFFFIYISDFVKHIRQSVLCSFWDKQSFRVYVHRGIDSCHLVSQKPWFKCIEFVTSEFNFTNLRLYTELYQIAIQTDRVCRCIRTLFFGTTLVFCVQRLKMYRVLPKFNVRDSERLNCQNCNIAKL